MFQQTKQVSFRGREDKLTLMAKVFQPYLQGDVLDVGCDRKFLNSFIKGKYVGIGMGGNPDIEVNLEKGLPFEDRSFDTLVCMDVLEHLEEIHFVFDELCRVASKQIIIGLPNMYEWRFRLMFLLGKKISGKYGLPIENPPDRHRWLLSLEDAKIFVHYRAEKNGFRVEEEVLGYYQYRKFLAKLFTRLGRVINSQGSSLFAYHYWAVIKRKA